MNKRLSFNSMISDYEIVNLDDSDLSETATISRENDSNNKK